MKCFVVLLMSALIAVVAHSGEVILDSGDRVSGSLVRLDGDNLVWKSNNFGEMRIKKTDVDTLRLDTPIKIDGHVEACHIVTMNEGQIDFACDDGALGRVAFTSLRQMLPFQTYEAGYYNYRGKLVASGRLTSGNTEEESWAIDSETVFRRGNFRHETDIEYYSVSTADSPADDRLQMRYGLDWFFKERWYWYNDIEAGYDQAAGIDEKYIYGSGFGFQVWDTDESAMSIETGLSYVSEDFEEPEMPTPDFIANSETSAWRWALNYRTALIAKAKFFHRHQLIRSLEDSYDWTLETETGVSMPLAGTLYAELKFDYDVDNFPTEGVGREDRQLSVGVGYSW